MDCYGHNFSILFLLVSILLVTIWIGLLLDFAGLFDMGGSSFALGAFWERLYESMRIRLMDWIGFN